jgi:6-phosphogluconolactonase/glucosamine-6-phosphate isomerase/deaminase
MNPADKRLREEREAQIPWKKVPPVLLDEQCVPR